VQGKKRRATAFPRFKTRGRRRGRIKAPEISTERKHVLVRDGFHPILWGNKGKVTASQTAWWGRGGRVEKA